MTKLVSILFWLAAFGCASVPSAVQAGSTKLAAHGGTGGASFSIDCGADFVLVGVRARKGGSVEQITGLCTKLSADNRWLGSIKETGSAGGTGGEEVRVTCPRDTVVRALRGYFGWYVNRMILRCRPLVSSASAKTIRADGSQIERSWSYKFCPSGKPARGFHGKSGWYIDSVGLICHTSPTPRLQAAPSDIVAVNVVDPVRGPSTAAPTPFVQVQWIDRSTAETGFRISIVRLPIVSPTVDPNAFRRSVPAAKADGVDSSQATTITDLPSGNYELTVCATFDVNGELCSRERRFTIAAGRGAPTITSVERVGAGTERVRWSSPFDNPSQFVVNARCGTSPFGPVASTLDGTARAEDFSIGVGDGEVQVCARYTQPDQNACSARATFQCN